MADDKADERDSPMGSELGQALVLSSTSAVWSTLDAVSKKASRRLGRHVEPRELDDLMVSVGAAELERHGVWRTSFGKKFMPIVLVNPAFARVLQTAHCQPGAGRACTCGMGGLASPLSSSSSSSSSKGNQRRDATDDVKRYYASHDYNAGRHASTASAHKPNCIMWRPPTAGHLHSWRRGFDN
jgi:hypothetical protein